tara:strand:- start:789 stop:4112 length:3324 start_codon:yes stop_codon:yes gene_type:complete
MGTFLKAHLRKTKDPVEIFFDYTDSILKADTNSFLDAVTDKGLTGLEGGEDLKQAIAELKSKFDDNKQMAYEKITNEYNKNRKKISGPPNRKTRLTFEEKQEQKEIKEKLKELEKKYKEDITDKELNYVSLFMGETEPYKDKDTSWLSNIQVYTDSDGKVSHRGQSGENIESKKDKKIYNQKQKKTTGWENYPTRGKTSSVGVKGNARLQNITRFINILEDMSNKKVDGKHIFGADLGLLKRLIDGFKELNSKEKGEKGSKYEAKEIKERLSEVSQYDRDPEYARAQQKKADFSKKELKALEKLEVELRRFSWQVDDEGIFYYRDVIENPLRELGLDDKNRNEVIQNLRDAATEKGQPPNLDDEVNREKYKEEITQYLRGQWYAKLLKDFNDDKSEEEMERLLLQTLDEWEGESEEFTKENLKLYINYDETTNKKLKAMSRERQQEDKKDKEKRESSDESMQEWLNLLKDKPKKVQIKNVDFTPIFLEYTLDKEKGYEEWADDQSLFGLQYTPRKGKNQTSIVKPTLADGLIQQSKIKLYNLLNGRVDYLTFNGRKKGTFLDAILWAVTKMRFPESTKEKELFSQEVLESASKNFKDIAEVSNEKFGEKYTFNFSFSEKKEGEIDEKSFTDYLEGRPIQLFDVDIKFLTESGGFSDAFLELEESMGVSDKEKDKVKTQKETKLYSEVGKIVLQFSAPHSKNRIDEKIEKFSSKFKLDKWSKEKGKVKGKGKGKGKVKTIYSDEYGYIKEELKRKLKREPTDEEIIERVEFYKNKSKGQNIYAELLDELRGKRKPSPKGKTNPRDAAARRLQQRATEGDKTVWLKNGKKMWDTWREDGTIGLGTEETITIDTDKLKVIESKDFPKVEYINNPNMKGKPAYKQIKVNSNDLRDNWQKVKSGSQYKGYTNKFFDDNYPDEAVEISSELTMLYSEQSKIRKEIKTERQDEDKFNKPKMRKVGFNITSSKLNWKDAPEFTGDGSLTRDWLDSKSAKIWREKVKDKTEQGTKVILEGKFSPIEWLTAVENKIEEKKKELIKAEKPFKKTLKELEANSKGKGKTKEHYERKEKSMETEVRRKGGYRLKNPTEFKKRAKTTKQSSSWQEILKVVR